MIVAFAGLVGYIAMPALAGLLILVGYRTIKPGDLQSVWTTGPVQKAVLLTTFALTMIIPLQYAVLVGVGLSLILHVVRQSNQVTIKRWRLSPDGDLIETDPPPPPSQRRGCPPGVTDVVAAEDIYAGDERVGATL